MSYLLKVAIRCNADDYEEGLDGRCNVRGEVEIELGLLDDVDGRLDGRHDKVQRSVLMIGPYSDEVPDGWAVRDGYGERRGHCCPKHRERR